MWSSLSLRVSKNVLNCSLESECWCASLLGAATQLYTFMPLLHITIYDAFSCGETHANLVVHKYTKGWMACWAKSRLWPIAHRINLCNKACDSQAAYGQGMAGWGGMIIHNIYSLLPVIFISVYLYTNYVFILQAWSVWLFSMFLYCRHGLYGFLVCFYIAGMVCMVF